MAHLLKFRKGWQSERIAKFVLSQFSFVAEPSTVADDIGSDFICTLFKVDGNQYLTPQNAFTIQIKSNDQKIEITENYSYFHNLELPYLVGVVNKNELTMRVYSGESIPHFFSYYGEERFIRDKYRAFIRLLENPPHRNHNFISCDDVKKECYLDFPFIAELSAAGPNNVDELIEVCKLIQHNISSRSSKSYVYYLYGWKGVNIYAGPGSVQTFRDNYFKRLAEVFMNLEWIYDRNKEQFDYDEYKLHKTTYENIIKKYGAVGGELETTFSRLSRKIDGI